MKKIDSLSLTPMDRRPVMNDVWPPRHIEARTRIFAARMVGRHRMKQRLAVAVV